REHHGLPRARAPSVVRESAVAAENGRGPHGRGCRCDHRNTGHRAGGNRQVVDFAIDYILIPFIKIALILAIVPGYVAIITLAERKIIAWMQVRLGPCASVRGAFCRWWR